MMPESPIGCWWWTTAGSGSFLVWPTDLSWDLDKCNLRSDLEFPWISRLILRWLKMSYSTHPIEKNWKKIEFTWFASCMQKGGRICVWAYCWTPVLYSNQFVFGEKGKRRKECNLSALCFVSCRWLKLWRKAIACQVPWTALLLSTS